MKPMEQLLAWQKEEQKLAESDMPYLCCLSTIGVDGYPHARYVSLKDINKQEFIMTSPLQSMKAKEMLLCPNASLTFYLQHTGRQVRVLGEAMQLSSQEADVIFAELTREIQILSWASDQSAEIDDPEKLEACYVEIGKKFESVQVPRPENWGGFMIIPSSIEFLDSPANHLQTRELYEKVGESWQKKYLQP